MCRSMVDIQSVAAEIRRGIKKEDRRRRKKLQGKNIMAPLLHRAAINSITPMVANDMPRPPTAISVLSSDQVILMITANDRQPITC